MKHTSIATALDSVERSLQADVRQSEAVQGALATGDVHALLTAFSETFLTEDQQAQVEHIIQLHKQCLSPLEYPS